MAHDFKTNLSNSDTWKRLVYLILFGIVGYVGLFIITLSVIVQFLLKLFTGRTNQRLRALSREIAAYYQQIICYLTLSADEKPYPFGPWPQVENQQTASPRRRTPGPRRVQLDAEEAIDAPDSERDI